MKVRCIYKAYYMWCEVGDILDVITECEADKRYDERYGIKLRRTIGFYPKKYFEVVGE